VKILLRFDKEVIIDAADIAPTVTWGTSPQDTVSITGVVPNPADCPDPTRRAGIERSLAYMGLTDKVCVFHQNKFILRPHE
jgi:homoaconitase/3-isopropylmalate dehydratase large subunit